MNTRICFCVLAVMFTCPALGQTAYAQSEDEAMQHYWQQTPKKQLKAPITPSCPEYIQKGEWNLEPFRPYVGSVITEQALCNPLKPNPDPDFQ